MKKFFLLLLTCALSFTFHSCAKDDNNDTGGKEDDTINVIDKIKDPYFKAHVALYVSKGWYKAENPDFLKPSEAALIKSIDISYTADRRLLKSLEGIEYFTGIETLRLSTSAVEQVDLSKNLKVQTIDIEDCVGSSMEIISPSVTTINAKYLQSKSLTLKTASLITYKGAFTNLESLVTNDCPKLEVLWCGGSTIKSLDLSNNLELIELSCGASGNISSHVLDISQNKKLKRLYASMGNNPLRKLYVWWDGGRDNIPSSFEEFKIEAPTEVIKK